MRSGFFKKSLLSVARRWSFVTRRDNKDDRGARVMTFFSDSYLAKVANRMEMVRMQPRRAIITGRVGDGFCPTQVCLLAERISIMCDFFLFCVFSSALVGSVFIGRDGVKTSLRYAAVLETWIGMRVGESCRC